VSTDARKLVQLGLLERRSQAGDRRDFYAVHPDGFRASLETRVANLRSFRDLIGEARVLAGANTDIKRRIATWEKAHHALVDAFEQLLRDFSK
jgi:DNA-binding transcriptional regulator GbsR (MarR family)